MIIFRSTNEFQPLLPLLPNKNDYNDRAIESKEFLNTFLNLIIECQVGREFFVCDRKTAQTWLCRGGLPRA